MSASFINFQDRDIWASQTFNSSGTFNVPTNVNHVFVFGAGGGGGGGGALGGAGAVSSTTGGGGAGSGGFQIVPVTAGGSVSVTIGAGGSGGNAANGSDGASSFFGSFEFKGGRGGQASLRPFSTSETIFFGGSGKYQGGSSVMPASHSERYSGGLASGGGAGYFGNGPNVATNASANTGAGGGGSTVSVNDLDPQTGANGGSGKIVVYWIKIK